MSEHVSVETGRALHQARWRRQPLQLGDWVCFSQAGEIGIVIGTDLGTVPVLGRLRAGPWSVRSADCIHLPTLGQLVEWLTARAACVMGRPPNQDPYVVHDQRFYEAGEQLVEAAAQAVLAMLEAQKEGSQ